MPEKVEIPLQQIAEAAPQGLMALSIQVGLTALWATMENEWRNKWGPKASIRQTGRRTAHEP